MLLFRALTFGLGRRLTFGTLIVAAFLFCLNRLPRELQNEIAQPDPRRHDRQNSKVAGGAEFAAKVVGIADGDTITVLHDYQEVKIRLAGVDAPEKSQPFGAKAKQFTSNLVFGKQVTVRVKELDQYGRAVAEILLPDGTSLNRELVRAGFAWWYRSYSHDASLGELEAGARAARRGLWADKNPQPPWEFRKQEKAQRTSARLTNQTGDMSG